MRTLSVQKQSTLVLEVVSTDSNSITLHWEVDGEDLKQNSFSLHLSEEGSGHWVERPLAAHLRRHVESGLKCGTKYLLYMTHQDKSTAGKRVLVATGQAVASFLSLGEMITTRTKGTVAISPSAEEFLMTNSTAVALNLNSWHNGGCAIRNYSLKYKQSEAKHWKVVSPIKHDSHEQRPFVISNLEPNRDYVLSVSAASTAGNCTVVSL